MRAILSTRLHAMFVFNWKQPGAAIKIAKETTNNQ